MRLGGLTVCAIGAAIGREFQSIKRCREECDVPPSREGIFTQRTKRLIDAGRRDGQHGEHVVEFLARDTAQKSERREFVLMQVRRELRHQRMRHIGGDAFDDKLVSGNAEREDGAFLERLCRPTIQRFHRALEQRMSSGIQSALVYRERELQHQLGERAREGGSLCGTRGDGSDQR